MAGPEKCGAQCKTWRGAPLDQWFYDIIVFSQPCCATVEERSYKALPQELSTFANVR